MIDRDEARGGGITRREALKRGLVVGGTAMWVAPAMQALTMSPASAQRPSGPPAGRGIGRGPDAGGGTGGLGNAGGPGRARPGH